MIKLDVPTMDSPSVDSRYMTIDEQIALIKEYGEKNEYPAMVVGESVGNIYSTSTPGKEAWEKIINFAVDKSVPHRETFLKLFEAVKNDKRYTNTKSEAQA